MTLETVIYEPGSGETLSLHASKVRVLTTAATSVGTATFEFIAAPGFDTGSHFHSRIEEQFFVIDGELEIRAGDRLFVGRPGTFVALPSGTTHAFANRGNLTARMLLVTAPPGHERYFAGLAEVLARGGAPDPDEIAALRARFDTVQVSPLST